MDRDVAQEKFAAWETAFRRAAEADGHAALAEHLRRFDLSIDPSELVQGTVDFVAASAALEALDGGPGSTLLDLQAYDPTASGRRDARTKRVCRQKPPVTGSGSCPG